MKNLIRVSALCIMLLAGKVASSQVLISLLFGEALNTPKIEFGLVGGWNRSAILDISDSKPLNNFNIGFYFHFMLGESQKHFISTGVLVKSNMGATGMPTYSVGNSSLDSLYADGTLTKKIHYFYVPVLYQHRIKNRVYLEGGFQVGLRNKANDIFDENTLGGDLSYTKSVKDDYTRLDVGLLGGVGFKFSTELKSPAVGVNYYYGLANVSTTETTIKNSSLYVYFKIPIGLGKSTDVPTN